MRLLLVIGLERGHALLQALLASPLGEIVHAVVLEEDPHEEAIWSPTIAAALEQATLPYTVARRLSATAWRELIADSRPDVIFVLGWRSLIDVQAIAAVPHGALAAHDSLLPDLRGFAPSSWGILLGRRRFGITLFRITDGIDTGPVLGQRAFDAGPRPRVGEVMSRIAALAPSLFIEFLEQVASGQVNARDQDETLATFGPKRVPDDGEIEWRQSNETVDRMVRALSRPLPGAFTWRGTQRIIIEEGEPIADPLPFAARLPGAVLSVDRLARSVDIMTGDGTFRARLLRLPGQPDQPATEILASIKDRLGHHRPPS